MLNLAKGLFLHQLSNQIPSHFVQLDIDSLPPFFPGQKRVSYTKSMAPFFVMSSSRVSQHNFSQLLSVYSIVCWHFFFTRSSFPGSRRCRDAHSFSKQQWKKIGRDYIVFRCIFSGCCLFHCYRYISWFSPSLWLVCVCILSVFMVNSHIFVDFRSSSSVEVVSGQHGSGSAVWSSVCAQF